MSNNSSVEVGYINSVFEMISQYSSQIIIGLALIVIILIINNIVSSIKLKKMIKKYNHFMEGNNGKNIEEILNNWIDKLQSLELEKSKMKSDIRAIEELNRSCLQKTSIIRYNSFENMGGDLCFAIAMLNGDDDGILLNGLHSREGSYIYAKPVVKGKCQYKLSEEENQALVKAINS